ncbi:Hypothetical protein CINCED_3A002535 [Cinara cedri]|uniref:Uncharacterized protein n=1 Tax=Cinara cedri TaxID=506608 RepID=A0A5E4MBQ9_9HEMI|nr:Hypothetical protein CINCED_3A002535 [Cinara cedri]
MKTGGVMIQVQRGQYTAQVIQDKIIYITNKANVRTIEQRGLIEIRYMDILTTKEKLAADLAKELGLNTNERKRGAGSEWELCTAGSDNVKNESNFIDAWGKVTRPEIAMEATERINVINAANKDTSFVNARQIKKN